MIPKIIHYCWLSNDPYPEDLQRCMNTWKEILPDYEFKLWNFEVFDKSSSEWVSEAFENKKYAFAADYIRLFAIYNYGGIYLDMDIQVLKSFNDLLDKDLIIAYENEFSDGLEAGCFGACKNNPIIKKCVDYYKGRHFIKEDGGFDTKPLPKIMMQFINKNNTCEIFDWYYFTCKSFNTGIISTTNYSYAIHNFAGSWLSEEQNAYLNKKRYFLNRYGCVGKLFMIAYICKENILRYGIFDTIKKISNFVSKKKKIKL